MAIPALNVYAYVGLDSLVARIKGSDLVDRGVYDDAASYVANDVVSLGSALFVALTGVTGVTPPAAGSWSILIKVSPQTIATGATRQGDNGFQMQADDGLFYDVGLERNQDATVMTIGQSGSL